MAEKILRLFEQSIDAEIDETKPLNEQTENLPYNPKYELPRESFIMTKVIGGGKFGKVYKGKIKFNAASSSKLVVAIKTPASEKNLFLSWNFCLESSFYCICVDPSDFHQYNDLVGEYKIMAYLTPHVNVISVRGICYISKNNELYLLTEFCEFGSLQEYLKRHKVNALLTKISKTLSARRTNRHRR